MTAHTSPTTQTSPTPHKKRIIISIMAIAGLMIACAGTPSRVEVYEAQTTASAQVTERWDQNPRLTAVIDFEAFDEAAARAAIYYATNEQRRAQGMSDLSREPLMEVSSQIHAERMRQYEFIAHEDPHSAKHRTPTDRARLAGVANPYTAENIATEVTLEYSSGDPVYVIPNKKGAFSKTPGGPELARHTYVSLARELLEGWMNSPGHRKNILNPAALSLGAGAAFYWQNNFPAVYAVQNFQFHEPVVTSE